MRYARDSWLRRWVAAGVLLVTLLGCSASNLPGGGPGGGKFRVTVEFADVLDLVPASAVKVNDVTVGRVERIWLSGWTARVRVAVSVGVVLPDNATAAVRQSSLLGEKFVELGPPANEPAAGRLSQGDVIGLARTRRSVEVEEVLAALALVLNGGGLQQVQTINRELGRALAGRESQVRDALRQVDAFVGALDAQKTQIVAAIDALDRLTGRLAAQQTTIGDAIDALAPGLSVLADQRRHLVDMLVALRRLGDVGTRVVRASRDDILAAIRALQPVLTELVRAGNDLPKGLDFLLSFPFPPNSTGAIVGDFTNLHITLDLNLTTVLSNVLSDNRAVPPDWPNTPPAQQNGNQTPVTPTAPDGTPLPSGESNARRGTLADLLLGGLTR